MIDYLEQSLERARQFLEELQRLERPLLGAKHGPDGLEPSGGAPMDGEGQAALDGERPSGEMASPGDERPAGERMDPGGERSVGEEPQAGSAERHGGDGPEEPGREERSPLLDQVEQLERAAALQNVSALVRERSAGSGPERSGGRDGWPQALPGAGGGAFPPDVSGIGASGWIPVGGPGQAGAAPADETRWAERADRAFRRDSRRYDGGFYLY